MQSECPQRAYQAGFCIFVSEKDKQMSKYGRITAAIRLISDSNTTVNGIPANRGEWIRKGHVYPKVGMVGEVLYVNGIQVLKICDGFYVPFSGQIEDISESDYLRDKYDSTSGKYTPNSMDHELDFIKERYGSRKTGNPSLMESLMNVRINKYLDAYMKAKAAMGGEIESRIRYMTAELNALPINDFSYEDAIDKFAILTAAEIEEMHWDPNDDQGIAWFVGLHADSYVKAMRPYGTYNFNEVFKKIYRKYLMSL